MAVMCLGKDDNEYYGTVRKFREDGTLEFSGQFYAGKMEGIYKEYYDSGKILKESHFSNDKKNGLEKIYYENGQVELAEEYLRKAKDNGEAYYLLGKLLEERKDLESAERYWKTAADDYDNKKSQEILSKSYIDKNNTTLAKHYLSLLADENHLEAFVLLGNMFSEEKNYNLAYTNYNHFFEGQSCTDVKVDMSKYDNEKLRFNFGKCCIKLGKVDMAEQNLKDNEYLKISDNIIEVAKLYEEAEQLKLALQYYKLALHIQ